MGIYARKKVHWVDLNRFDVKSDKSTWLEMAAVMEANNLSVEIYTGYKDVHFYPEHASYRINYFDATNKAGLFRISLLISILLQLVKSGRKEDIYILSPGSLYMALVLRTLGRKKVHLDVRTLPVDIYSMKDRVDRLLFWVFPMKLLSRLVKSYSYITEPLRTAVHQEFGQIDKEALIWGSGVNTAFFRAVSKDLQSENSKFRLFYHGTITKNRGVVEIVRAMNELPENLKSKVELEIVGAGSGVEEIEELVAHSNLDGAVTLVGMVAYAEIPERISKANCCICPLPDRPEWNVSSPLKLFEYLAADKPIILTPILAHKAVVDGLPYIVWTRGSSGKDIAEAIETAYKQKEELAELAMAGSKFVEERFDWLCQGKKLSDYLFRNLIFDLESASRVQA